MSFLISFLLALLVTNTAAEERIAMPQRTNGLRFVSLLQDDGLDGWRVVGGNATIDYEGQEVHGYGQVRRNTFLMSDAMFGDFVLEGEVKLKPASNSGFQVRSRLVNEVNPKSGVLGYQLEVDGSSRAWSGGLYEEAARAWIHPLKGDEPARAAFKQGEWNHYRIELSGPHIRSWVNGVPCADVLDFAAFSGAIALQVHNGNSDVRFRNLRIASLGQSVFAEAVPWREPNGSIHARANTKPTVFQTPFIGPKNEKTARFRYTLDGVAEVRALSASGKALLNITLDTKNPKAHGSISSPNIYIEDRYPVVAPGAGLGPTSNTTAEREFILDIDGPRLTIIENGQLLKRVRFDDPINVAVLEVALCRGQGDLELHPAECIVRTSPRGPNEASP